MAPARDSSRSGPLRASKETRMSRRRGSSASSPMPRRPPALDGIAGRLGNMRRDHPRPAPVRGPRSPLRRSCWPSTPRPGPRSWRRRRAGSGRAPEPVADDRTGEAGALAELGQSPRRLVGVGVEEGQGPRRAVEAGGGAKGPGRAGQRIGGGGNAGGRQRGQAAPGRVGHPGLHPEVAGDIDAELRPRPANSGERRRRRPASFGGCRPGAARPAMPDQREAGP